MTRIKENFRYFRNTVAELKLTYSYTKFFLRKFTSYDGDIHDITIHNSIYGDLRMKSWSAKG
jgi:hypothetical protein